LQDSRLYRVINHVCRVCGGRLLKSDPNSTGGVRVRCADCGCREDGNKTNKRLHEKVCACGARLTSFGNVGLKCGVNARMSIEMPEEIVANVTAWSSAPRREPQNRPNRDTASLSLFDDAPDEES